MTRLLFAGVALCTVIGMSSAFADDRDFKLINATGYPIKSVYIDESSSDSWTDNSIDAVMNDGDEVNMKFGKGDKGCKWDMKVVWTDNTSSVWKNFDLCTIEVIKLHYNRDTDAATAEVK
jgi:hypothetical protein